jgi:uncharacterized protein
VAVDPSSPASEAPIRGDLLGDLIASIRRQYRLSWTGVHGVAHWARVLENGLRLAPVTGADPEVVTLFALFHDACRRNDHIDPRHGARGAALAASLLGEHFDGRPHQLHLLLQACALHTEGGTEADATVATCWDADRLDLLRVGIRPEPHRLCTAAARDPEVLAWANDRARRDHLPGFAEDGWLRLR